MRFIKSVFYLTLATMAVIAQQVPRISVHELPPETIPQGTCKQGHSGYLGVEGTKYNRFDLSEKEIGEYVVKKLSEGYSLSLYPQDSGRIFSIATCEATASQ
jgi:hypothetical protein